jgi:hypothetical protein
MKRLIDDHELSGADARLAELVRKAERFEPDPARKRSVLSRLRAPISAGFRMRGPTLAVALLCVGTAGAAAGYDWTPPRSSPEAGEQRADRVSLPAQPVPASQSKPALQAQSTALAEPPAPTIAEQRRAGPARPVAPRSRAPEKAAHRGEDPGPVLDAIRALRKSRDPARAQQLLDGYLQNNPRGALSEDALGLAIEAAAARRDPRAADYARRYLARFPNGRFRSTALRAAERR